MQTEPPPFNPYAEVYARITGADSIEEAFQRDGGVRPYVGWMQTRWSELLAARNESGISRPLTLDDVVTHLNSFDVQGNGHDHSAHL